MIRSESVLVRAILEAYAGHPRIALWRANTGVARVHGSHVRFGKVGAADITGLRDALHARGQRIEIECKTEKGKQRPEQVEFQRMIEHFGGIYILARLVEDVKAVLDATLRQDELQIPLPLDGEDAEFLETIGN